MTTDTNSVAIIGVGLHPFDRFDKTAMKMGAEAIQSALTDARDPLAGYPVRLRRQLEVSNPDA
jgi:acetyl-CoA C-acetyltransferase